MLSIHSLVAGPISVAEGHVRWTHVKLGRSRAYAHWKGCTLLLLVGVLVSRVHVEIRLAGVDVHLVATVLGVAVSRTSKLLVVVSVGGV